jgi:hypothetical protein
VVTAAIYGRDANDSPILPELVAQTAEGFTVKEVSGDKGFLSAENVEAIAAAGGVAFIAPKSNTTGGIGSRRIGRFCGIVVIIQIGRIATHQQQNGRDNQQFSIHHGKQPYGYHAKISFSMILIQYATAEMSRRRPVPGVTAVCPSPGKISRRLDVAEY